MPTPDQVEALIRDFAQKLRATMREQLAQDVTAAVQAALAGRGTGTGRKPGRAGQGQRGAKRTPEEIEKQAARLLAYIARNPDQRAEQLARANQLSTGELVLPIKRLLEDKKIKASGRARGTTYAVLK